MGGLNGNKRKSVPISKRQVYEGYQRVRSNSGGSGVDQMSLQDLEADLGRHLYKLWNRLSSGSYFPPAVKRVYLSKGGNSYRPLGIPTVLDRIAQTVVKEYCETRLEAIFSDSSYGYRPKRSAHDALESCRKNCWRQEWVIDMDIKGYFDNIDHKLLTKAVERHFPEKWVRMYLGRWLRAEVLHPDGTYEEPSGGTPQGGVISPLLSNLFLHYAFDVWMERDHKSMKFERYADDIIVHCTTETEAESLLRQISQRLTACRLDLHPEKTRIVYCQRGKRPNQTNKARKFTFLGYDFKPRKQWNKKKEKTFLAFDLGISHKSSVRIRSRIRMELKRFGPQVKLEHIAGSLNARLRGWTYYFAKLNRYAIRRLWAWFNRRLIRWLMRNRKRFKGRIRATARWLRWRSRMSPQLFVHWQFGCTP